MTGAIAILRQARRAHSGGGISVMRQLYDMARLRLGEGKIRPNAYFAYRLFDPRLSFERKRAYVDEWARPSFYAFDDRDFYAIGKDKLLFYTLMNAWRLPYPRIIAVVHRSRVFMGAALLRSADDVLAFLGQPSNFPFFVKRVNDIRGRGAGIVEAYDPDNGELRYANGQIVASDRFIASVQAREDDCIIFQQLIRTEARLAEAIGSRVATARVMTIADGQSFKVKRAVLRLPVGANMTDNFSAGSTGNAYALVDAVSGRVIKAYRGVGLDMTVLDAHPDTGVALDGLQLPDWGEAMRQIEYAATRLPGLRLAGWDVAFTDDGPMLLEVNAAPGVVLPQLHGGGLIDADTKLLMRKKAERP